MTYKNSLRIVLLIVLIAPLALIQSCYKDPFDFDKIAKSSVSPDMAVPLVHSRLSLLKLLDAGKLTYTTDADNFLSLIYSDTIFSKLGEELFSFPNQVFDTNFVYPLTNIHPGDVVERNYLFTHGLKTQASEIVDSILFLEGFYKFKITSFLNQSSVITITIPDLTKNGQVFKKVIDFPYMGSLNTKVIEFDLAGYQYVFQKSSPTTTILSEDVNIKTYIGNDTNNSAYTLSIRKEIHGIKFQKLYGYLGQKDYDLGDNSLKLNIFDNNAAGAAYLEDPRLNLRFFNSFGMPIKIEMPTLVVERDGGSMSITSPLLNNILIDAPTLADIGSTVQTNYTFNISNSNVKDAFNFMPKKINYKITGKSNPNGLVTPNFCLNTSQFYAVVEAEMPLFGKALSYTLQDTSKLTIEKDPNIEYIEVRIHTKSFIPAETKLQIQFADSNNVVLDSLFSTASYILKSPVPGPPPGYRVTAAVSNNIDVRLDKTKLNKIYNTKKIFIRAYISTANSGTTPLKLYADYVLDVNIGLRAKYKVEF